MKLSTIKENLVYKRLIDKVHGVLRSKHCLLCLSATQEQLPLCHACKADLPYLTHCCQRCALPLQYSQQDLLCGQCLQKEPIQARTFSLFSYQTPVAQMLSHLK
ncbi:MAG TPA: double zinc ribbon domain-containing protein, partial [Pseudomonadales bacterium]|nr:double zinc ribbon domain-containing protein [Pseudomonadales bacterium]